MLITFLTRKYPPIKGGMETFSFELIKNYPGSKLIFAYASKKQIDIIWLSPLLFIRALKVRKKTTLYHLGDLVLAPLALLLKKITKKPVVATVHGLEITYLKTNKLYRMLIKNSLSAIDHFVCVSQNTEKELHKLGIEKEKTSVIPHGVQPPKNVQYQEAKQNIFSFLNKSDKNTQNKFLLLSVGRHVKRKGLSWFISEVLPLITKINPLLIITSTGPETDNIKTVISEKKLESFVQLIGQVNDHELQQLYHGTDLFIMPNIPVTNDIEGFGFVAIEAAAAGLPVIAANVDGIPAAIHNQKNGILIEPQNATAFAQQIMQWYANPNQRKQFGQQAQQYTLDNFSWPDIAKKYQYLFENLLVAQK